MSNPNHAQSIGEEIDRVADRFEAAWKGSAVPDLGDFLAGYWEPGPRRRLLRELILLDKQYRRRRELPCEDADYIRRWPEAQELLADATVNPVHEAPLERIGRY